MSIVPEFFVQMRIAGAVGGPYLVNGTHVRLQIQELAGLCLVQPVPVAAPLLVQPFFLKGLLRHIEVSGNSFDILLVKSGGH